MTSRLMIGVALAVLSLSACRKSSAPSASTSAAHSAAPAPPRPAPQPPMIPRGPRFAILPGQGVGPIRPGATVATLERHMEAKCEQLTAKSCRYITRGIEFHLDEKGAMTRLHIHRPGRSAGSTDAGLELSWGPFNGRIPPDLTFGMLPTAIQEHLGPPKKVVSGAAGAHSQTAEQHVYEKMVLEYERLPSSKLVLGGIRIPD